MGRHGEAIGPVICAHQLAQNQVVSPLGFVGVVVSLKRPVLASVLHGLRRSRLQHKERLLVIKRSIEEMPGGAYMVIGTVDVHSVPTQCRR